MPQMSRPLVEATATSEVAHKANQQKDTKAEAKNKQSPNHQSRGSKRKEQDSQATGLETVQAGTAPGGSKQAEPRPHDGPPIRRLRKKTAATEVEHTSVDNAEHRTVPEQLEETNESDTESTPSTCGSQGMATKIHAWNASAPSGQPRIYLVEHLHYLGTSAQRMQGGRHMICQVTTALSAHAPLCARHQRNFKAICGTSMRPLCLLSARIRAQHTSARHKLHTKHI